MANLYLTLDLKNHELYDDDRKLSFDFRSWSYDLKNKEFELDDMTISYDAIYEFKYEKDLKSDVAYVEIEDDTVFDIDISNEYENYLSAELSLAVENFIRDKNLADGEYKVNYNFYYDFSEAEFVINVLEVIAND